MEIPASDPLAQSVTTAIHTGDAAALKQLLAANPELVHARIIDAKNGSLRTLLHIATDWPGHFPNVAESIRALLAAGADPDVACIGPNPHRESPLHWAASSDDVNAMEALLDGGADIEFPGAVFTGGAPMSDAVIFANWNAARLLLERGAKTTFTQSAALGLMDRVAKFFDAEPAPAPNEITAALWHACRGGQLPMVEYLVSKGANRNWLGWDNLTPLDGAEQSGNAQLVAWLRGQGARTAHELAQPK